MIRGSAFATTVEARIATNMPTIRPDNAWRTSRRDIRVPVSAGGTVAVVIELLVVCTGERPRDGGGR